MPPKRGHRGDADDRLAGPARKNDHARTTANIATGMEGIDRHPLIVAYPERAAGACLLAEGHLHRRAVGVSRKVFGRVSGRDERLLQEPAIAVIDPEGRLADPVVQILLERLLPRQLFEQGSVGRDQNEVGVATLQPHTAVSTHQLLEVDRKIRRERKLAESRQRVDHLIGGEPGSGRVPQRQGGESIRVDMLGAFLQFREWSKRVAGLGVERVIDLQKDGSVPLDDERVGRVIRLHGLLAAGPRVVSIWAWPIEGQPSHRRAERPSPQVGF